MKSEMDSVLRWCTADSMKFNISAFLSRKPNIFTFVLCQSSITRTDSIKDLPVFLDSKLHFHTHTHRLIPCLFLQCINLKV
jgi:hypothetical protein